MCESSMESPNLDKKLTYSDEVPDMIFGFLEEDEFSVTSLESKVETIDEEDDEDEEENTSNSKESKVFWESQKELLQVKDSLKPNKYFILLFLQRDIFCHRLIAFSFLNMSSRIKHILHV